MTEKEEAKRRMKNYEHWLKIAKKAGDKARIAHHEAMLKEWTEKYESL